MARWYEALCSRYWKNFGGLAMLPSSPMANGLLSGKYGKDTVFGDHEGLPQRDAPVSAGKYGTQPGAFWELLKNTAEKNATCRFRWRGCCAKSLTSYRFPVPVGFERLTENLGAADVELFCRRGSCAGCRTGSDSHVCGIWRRSCGFRDSEAGSSAT